MSNCGGYNYSKSKCGQVPKASTCGQAHASGQMPETTGSCVSQQVSVCQQRIPKAFPMTQEAASHIQSNADKTATNQESKASAQSAAVKNIRIQEEKKKEDELAMSYH